MGLSNWYWQKAIYQLDKEIKELRIARVRLGRALNNSQAIKKTLKMRERIDGQKVVNPSH